MIKQFAAHATKNEELLIAESYLINNFVANATKNQAHATKNDQALRSIRYEDVNVVSFQLTA